MPTITVFGTSNSIMTQGWVNQIRLFPKAKKWVFENRSIGGASSRHGAYSLETSETLHVSDRIIVDFCVNDQMYLETGDYDIAHILSHYISMMIALNNKRVLNRLLVVMFPHKNPNSELFTAVRNLLDIFGVDYIDFRNIVHEWSGTENMQTNEVYLDPRNFSPGYQRQIGEIIFKHLRKNRPNFRKHLRAAPARSLLKRLEPVGYCDLKIIGDSKTKILTLGTSLLRQKVIRFQHGDSFSIEGAPFLLGAHIWVTPKSGVMTIRGAEIDFRIHFRRRFKSLFLFETLIDPVRLRHSADIQVINDRNASFQMMFGQESSVYDDADSEVEIVALIGGVRDPLELYLDLKAELETAMVRVFFPKLAAI